MVFTVVPVAKLKKNVQLANNNIIPIVNMSDNAF